MQARVAEILHRLLFISRLVVKRVKHEEGSLHWGKKIIIDDGSTTSHSFETIKWRERCFDDCNLFYIGLLYLYWIEVECSIRNSALKYLPIT